MVAKRDWSIAFWSAARALVIFFFYKNGSLSVYASFPHKLKYLIGTYLWLLSLLEESLLGLLLLGLLLGEVFGNRDLLEGSGIDTAEVNLAAGGDHIASVHPSERDTVDLKGTCNEEDALGQVLEEDNPLTAETTSEEDQNSTRLEALTRLGGADGFADL